jgi:hypothetical protein
MVWNEMDLKSPLNSLLHLRSQFYGTPSSLCSQPKYYLEISHFLPSVFINVTVDEGESDQ